MQKNQNTAEIKFKRQCWLKNPAMWLADSLFWTLFAKKGTLRIFFLNGSFTYKKIKMLHLSIQDLWLIKEYCNLIGSQPCLNLPIQKRKSQNLPFLDECLNVYANATTINSRFILLNKESCNLIGSQPCLNLHIYGRSLRISCSSIFMY